MKLVDQLGREHSPTARRWLKRMVRRARRSQGSQFLEDAATRFTRGYY